MGPNKDGCGAGQWQTSLNPPPAAALERDRVSPVDAPSTPLVAVLCSIDKRRRLRCDSLTCSRHSILYSIRVVFTLRLPLDTPSRLPLPDARTHSFTTTIVVAFTTAQSQQQ